MGTLVISQRENGTYKYTYNNRKGNVIFTSNSHQHKTQCMSEITVLKRNFDRIDFLKYKTPSGKMYFRIVVNEFVLGSSRKFTTPLLMEKGMDDLKKNFLNSEVLDFTEDIFGTINELETVEGLKTVAI
ncbi:hypothetical protein AB4865_04815 [Capnocytophaga sp. ARDL2]|uniref:hypothetical protein n=1 Tax=Capnocytophaga sp. ARDL2 TaxID=3238809 RepID=UPI0035567574